MTLKKADSRGREEKEKNRKENEVVSRSRKKKKKTRGGKRGRAVKEEIRAGRRQLRKENPNRPCLRSRVGERRKKQVFVQLKSEKGDGAIPGLMKKRRPKRKK